MKRKIWISFLALLIANNCYATTEFICTFNKTGQDYSSIQNWENAIDNAGDITDDTVFTGDYDGQVNDVIADATAVTWDSGSSGGTLIHQTATQYLIDVTSGSLADDDVVTDGTNSFVVNGTPDDPILVLELYADSGKIEGGYILDATGNTCDTTNHLEIRAAADDWHDGTKGSGVWVEVDTSQYAFVVRTGGVFVVRVFELTDTNGAASDMPFVSVNGTTFEFDRMIMHSIRPSNGLHLSGIYYNFGAYAWGGTFRNCSVYADGDDCGWSNEICIHTGTLYNTILFNSHENTTYSSMYNCSGDYNISEGNAPGANSLDNQTLDDIDFTNVSSGSEDFHILSTSVAKDEGSDQSAYLTIDVDGDTFGDDGTWDIGADEYVGGAEPPATNNSRIIFISKLWLEALKASI